MGAYSRILLPWDSQPQEAVGANTAWEPAGLYHPSGYDAVSGAPATSITAPRVATRAGLGLQFADGSEVAQYPPIQVSAAQYSTLTVLIPNFSSASNDRQGIWHVQATPGSVQNRLRMIWLNAAFGWYLDTNGSYAYYGPSTFAAGDVLVIGFTKGAGNTGALYVNGAPISITQNWTSDAGTPAAAAPMWLGDDVEASSGWRLNGSIVGHSHFHRQLSAAEMAELSRNVWQLFAPHSIWVPVSAGGSPPTFQAAWARNANTILKVA